MLVVQPVNRPANVPPAPSMHRSPTDVTAPVPPGVPYHQGAQHPNNLQSTSPMFIAVSRPQSGTGIAPGVTYTFVHDSTYTTPCQSPGCSDNRLLFH